MKKTKPDTESFLNDLSKGAHPRTQASLRLIFEICNEQHERGSRDFSIAMIGGLSAERGGPSAAAIRNKTGEKYRALIAACADSVGGKKRKSVSVRVTQADEILEGVIDPVLRARLGLLLAELRSTKVQLSAARHLASQNAVVDLPVQPTGQTAAPSHRILTDSERKSLASAISKKTLDHWGWKVDQSGRVLTERDQVVFGIGFVTAIEKLLG